MNASFIDYDFSKMKPESFIQQTLEDCKHIVNSYLAEVCINQPDFINYLWKSINDAVTLHPCEIYSYIPNLDDPLSDGTLWSFNYFFVNKELRRICYFKCVAIPSYRRIGSQQFSYDNNFNDDDQISIEDNYLIHEDQYDDNSDFIMDFEPS